MLTEQDPRRRRRPPEERRRSRGTLSSFSHAPSPLLWLRPVEEIGLRPKPCQTGILIGHLHKMTKKNGPLQHIFAEEFFGELQGRQYLRRATCARTLPSGFARSRHLACERQAESFLPRDFSQFLTRRPPESAHKSGVEEHAAALTRLKLSSKGFGKCPS